MTDRPSGRPVPSLSRRTVLRYAGLTGIASVLAACGAGASSPPSPSAAPSVGPVGPSPSPRPSIGSSLAIYHWADDISPDNIAEFERRYAPMGVREDTFASHTALLETLRKGNTGFDIGTPSAEYLPTLIKDGLVAPLDMARIPTARFVDPAFQRLWWDPDQRYHVPKELGDLTGILYRGNAVSLPPRSWKEFAELVRGEASGKTVFVDSMDDVLVLPLKLLGHSLNSVDKTELKAARTVLLEMAPHVLAVDSDTYGQRLANGEAALALGWSGPLRSELATPATADARWVVPAEGTRFRIGTWTILTDAPNPDAAYAWLDFIGQPEIAAEESDHSGYATLNTEARALVDRSLLDDPAVYPPPAVIPNLEAARDNSANTQRLDIWEEFKARVAA